MVVVVVFRAAKAARTASSICGPSSPTTWLTRELLSVELELELELLSVELELELEPELKPEPEPEVESVKVVRGT